MNKTDELEEIAHIGGKVTFDIITDAGGKRSSKVGWSASIATPASLFAIYALPQGVPVGDIVLGGIGTPFNPAPVAGCLPVFIASDTTGMFGRQCSSCGGYWRGPFGARICPYCGIRVEGAYRFMTDAQLRYVKHYCETFADALASDTPQRHVIDLDAVVDATGTARKPAFYYAEERQQNLFTCSACSEITDVLGTYSYCSACGTRNDLEELGKIIKGIRNSVNSGGSPETCAKECVAAFDSCAAQYAKQLAARIPMTGARKARLERALFHNLHASAELFREYFGIDILDGLSEDERAFATLMFYRRHVYEHKGGEADARYIAESGDDVRPKQALRETRESVHRLANCIVRLGTNLHSGFQDIFPPIKEPIQQREEERGVSTS